MKSFTIFPAIDLRGGKVVRLTQGDPNRQKIYNTDPSAVAQSMIADGASWLHVINLDGAFGDSSSANFQALAAIVENTRQKKTSIQFGGGLHTLEQIDQVLSSGVTRVILGSLAARQPEIVHDLVQKYGAERIAVSLDGRNKEVMVSGWQEASGIGVFDLATRLKSYGLKWLVYTDITRDGMQTGSDFETTVALAQETGLNIIASGGVSTPDEVQQLMNHGVAGAIIGKALYESSVKLSDLIRISREDQIKSC